MVLELAMLDVLPDHREAFERDLAIASRDVLPRAAGFHQYTGHGWGVERPNTYVFTVRWESVDHHRSAFAPGTDLLAEWEALMGPHLAGPGSFEHYGADR